MQNLGYLFFILENNLIEDMQNLLKEKKSEMNEMGIFEMVCKYGSNDMIKLFIEDPEIDLSNIDNEVLLELDLEMAKMLLKSSKLDLSRGGGDIVWMLTDDKNRREILDLILESPGLDLDYSLVKIVRDKVEPEIIESILKYPGINPASDNNLALSTAVLWENPKIIDVLLKDPRCDPLECYNEAVKNGNTKILNLIHADPRFNPNNQR